MILSLFTPEVRRQGCEASQSLISSAEVNIILRSIGQNVTLLLFVSAVSTLAGAIYKINKSKVIPYQAVDVYRRVYCEVRTSTYKK
jgi:hypothetical protein